LAQFTYRGRNAHGDLVSGRLEAADTAAVADQLLSTGVTPVDIRESAGAAAAAPDWWRKLTAPEITDVDLMLFSRQMDPLLKAGVPIMQALGGLQESAINPSLKDVIRDLRTSLDAGRELSSAMRRHPKVFSGFYIAVVRVGETTGQLEHAFNRLFKYIEFDRDIRERIKTAVRYPMIVLVVVSLAVAVVNLFVIPAFAKIYEASKVALPLLTRVLIATSEFFVISWPILVAAIVGAVFAFKTYTGTVQGRYNWDRVRLRLPVAGPIILKATLARLTRSLALTIESGVPIVQGITVVGHVMDNSYMARRVEQMRDGVERGESILRTANAAGVFTPTVLQMIAVGEESGALDDLLNEVADMYEREVDYEIKNLATNIEPILTVALGILILILALGVFLPIWELGRVMLRK
jgi:MSHA biogenesis protein MshG